MSFESDKSAMTALALSDAELGRLLGKSRQAINIGLNRHKTYLEPHELKVIVREISKDRSGADLESFREYIAASRPEDAESVFETSRLPVTPFNKLDADRGEIWAVLPDYRYFEIECPVVSRAVLELYFDNPSQFRLITTTLEDKARFVTNAKLVAKSGQERQMADALVGDILGEANAYPYLIIRDPNKLDGRKCYVLTRGEFQEIPEARGRAIIERLRQLLESQKADSTVEALS